MAMDNRCSRRAFVRDFLSILCAGPFVAACTPKMRRPKVRRIGFIVGVGYDPEVAAFKNELRSLGYIR